MIKKLVSEIISTRVRISPTQIAAYYYSHPQEFYTPKTVRFSVLQLKPSPDMNIENIRWRIAEITDKIRAGEEFALLVQKYSQGPNAEKGGDMGYMPADDIIKEISDALSGMTEGEISGAIKTSTGFYIVKLIEKKEAKTKTLTEVTDAIRERLFQREAELTLREFVNKLRKDAYIKIQ